MNISELKLQLFKKVDSLDKSRLEELYGLVINYINVQKDISDWEKLTDKQKQGIVDAIDEIDSGKGIPHYEVISKIR